MEALVVVSHLRNHHHYYGRKCDSSHTRFGSLGDNCSGRFPGISCRAFESGLGLLPTPVTESVSPSIKLKTPSPCLSKDPNFSERFTKSSSIPIPIRFDYEAKKGNELHVYETWAGPAYSNSPPPSSLPFPTFSLPPGRTILLDVPGLPSEIDTHPDAKSAPTSKTLAYTFSSNDLFGGDDSATRTLCRILNLDVTDE